MYAKLLLQRNNMRRPSVIRDARGGVFLKPAPPPPRRVQATNRTIRYRQVFLRAGISSGTFKTFSSNFPGFNCVLKMRSR